MWSIPILYENAWSIWNASCICFKYPWDLVKYTKGSSNTPRHNGGVFELSEVYFTKSKGYLKQIQHGVENWESYFVLIPQQQVLHLN